MKIYIIDVNVWRICNWIFAQAKIAIVYSRFNKNRSCGTHCVVTLFKAKVLSRVNVEYPFVRYQNTVCNFVERLNAYNVLCKVEMTILFLTCIFKIVIFIYLYLRSILYFALIYIIYYFLIFFQRNSIIICYVCVQLIKFIYIYIFICICFVSNKVLLKVIKIEKGYTRNSIFTLPWSNFTTIRKIKHS